MGFKEFIEKIVFPFDSVLNPKEDSEENPSPKAAASSKQTLYFKNGQLYKIIGGSQDNWYDADFIVSDGRLYDLSVYSDIRSIPVPSFQTNISFDEYGITGSLEYVLRMKAGKYFNRYERDLCSACLWKSTEMMLSCATRWQKEDFNRIIHWHIELDMKDEAEKARKWLMSFPVYTENRFDSIAKSNCVSVLNKARIYKLDFVVFNDSSSVSCCCSECAKYRGRVYSISGKSKIYPALPEYVKEHGNFHPGCRCVMSPYFDGSDIYLRGKQVNPKLASLRPWIDDRTDKEKEMYENYVSESTSSNEYFYDEEKIMDRRVYYTLLKEIPEYTPKSFSSYRRMKNSNTANFQKLMSIAKEIGIET